MINVRTSLSGRHSVAHTGREIRWNGRGYEGYEEYMGEEKKREYFHTYSVPRVSQVLVLVP